MVGREDSRPARGQGTMGASERNDAHPLTAGVPGPVTGGRTPTSHSHTRIGGQPLRVEVVTELADLEALSDRWTALVYASPLATAYASPAFVLTWYRHFERPGGIYTITVWHHDQLVGLAPFARTRIGHPPAAITLLVSAGTEHGDYGDPLLGPAPPPAAHTTPDPPPPLGPHRTLIN